MSKPEDTEPTGKKQIRASHRDLIAAAEVYDILDALPLPERNRVLGWINHKYIHEAPKPEKE